MKAETIIVGNGIDAKKVEVANCQERLDNADAMLTLFGFRFTACPEKKLNSKEPINPFI